MGLPGFSRCSSSRFWNGFSCCAVGTLVETSLVGVDGAMGTEPVGLAAERN